MNPKLKDAYILDDFAPFVAILNRQLIASDKFDNVFTFTNEEDLISALKAINEYKVPYLFLEFYLKNKKLTLILNRIKAAAPKAKVIVISTFTNPSLINSLLKFKPDGIVHKADKPYDIIDCIEKVNNGLFFCSGIIKQILRDVQKTKSKSLFTPKETELLNFWARNYTVEKTAATLNLSFHTIVAHRRNMFKKANCHTKEELLAYAKLKKIID